MNKGFICIVSFAVGAIGGSIATWKLLKTKYEQFAREEVEEVREYYANKYEGTTSTEQEKPNTEVESITTDDLNMSSDVRTEYSSIASVYSSDNEEGGDKPMSRNKPYVISPAEFGEMENYETITLVYYNDGILADNDGNIIEDIESCIGYEALNHFGEYEDDSVHVRNEDAMTDYEVLLDETDYADLEGLD